MRVEPEHASVGSFFLNSPMFRVPKYQRSYAWEKSEIDDYLKDLDECYNCRKSNQPSNHFFGGMVSVEKKVTGVVKQHEYELVDGQQRCATFVITIAALINSYYSLLDLAKKNGDAANEKIITNRINRLFERFIEFEQEVNRNTEKVEALVLSKADEQFFRDLTRNNSVYVDRESHTRLKNAFYSILEKINDLKDTAGNITQQIDNLEHIQMVIDVDFSIIHIVTYSHKEAYKLFQVLNDRGKSLTEGDLLRAKTLELLEGFNSRQSSSEDIWNNILKDNTKETEYYLKWIYASYKGKRPGRSTLFDDYLEAFFPENNLANITSNDADNIQNTIREILEEIKIARKISIGSWPFSSSQRPITGWDRNRLNLLIRELGLTVSLPLLLASFHLGEIKFSKITQILELFLFKYKIISNAHIEAAVSIFHKHCLLIRANITTYDIGALRTDLNSLMSSKVNEIQFRASLDGLSYTVGGGNKPLKYLLMTLEHYKRWYDLGANGTPKCLDKTRIYDFSSTTIEHVYPRNASGNVIDATLEPFKNSIENLTFMGPTDNVAGRSDSFQTKKSIFLASSVGLNIDIGNLTQWSTLELTSRKLSLKNMACAIFVI